MSAEQMERFLAALTQFGDQRAVLDLDILTVIHLIAQLQLALRHPANVGDAARAARTVIDKLEVGLRNVSTDLADLIAAGNDPAQDEPVEAQYPWMDVRDVDEGRSGS